MNDAELEKKLASDPSPEFKGWRFIAWKQDFKHWSRDYDATEMRLNALTNRFKYVRQQIMEGRW